jgi:hypothetical protein
VLIPCGFRPNRLLWCAKKQSQFLSTGRSSFSSENSRESSTPSGDVSKSGKFFSILRNVQIGSEALPHSSLMGTGGIFPGGKAAGVWKNGGPPLPHTSLNHHHHHHDHLQGLNLLACSIPKYKIIVLLLNLMTSFCRLIT